MQASNRVAPLVIALVIVLSGSTAAIVTTYTRLSHTWDEATHVVAGLEVLQDGTYTFQTENPPLSRVPLAVIPFLNGARMPSAAQRAQGAIFAADTIYYRSPSYIQHVTEGRLANLLFFWCAVALTWTMAGGRSDPWVAFLASALVATLPAIVAHSGFATTDMPFVVSFLLAMLSLRGVLRRPSLSSAALTGGALGIAIATKFSTLVFLPATVIGVVVMHVGKPRASGRPALTHARLWRLLLVIGGVCLVVIWASYGFRVGRLSDLPTRFGRYGTMPTTGWPAVIRDWRLPAHEFIHGLLFLRAHTIAGHGATLFDEFSQRGFWLYYPVVLATKTPLPFLLFAGVGLSGLARIRDSEDWRWFAGLALGALGLLLVAMTSPINLGVRHVLAIYPLVAIASAFGVVRMAERSGRRGLVMGAAAGCVTLQGILLMLSVPNQITYFNLFAGSDPAHISSDSDFDWGQHAIALEQYFFDHPVPEVYVLLYGSTQTCTLTLPPVKSLPNHPVTGWIAVSETPFRLNRGVIREDPCDVPGMPGKTFTAPAGWLDWLKDKTPVAIIGKTVRLYHVPVAQ
jgi:hypothetical protein